MSHYWPSRRQLSLFSQILNHGERQVALGLIIICLISGAWLIWRWHEKTTVVIPRGGGEYSEVIVGLPRTANPLLATNDAELDLSRLTHRGLFKYNQQGQTVVDLAAGWKLSPDGKSYEITLRPNLKWSDGAPLTIDDVIFTFNSLQNKNLNSPRAAEFREVTIDRRGEQTISFALKDTYAPFLSALTIGIIPAHIWQNLPPEQWLNNNYSLQTVGAGPFRFKNLWKDQSGNVKNYSLEPNPYTHTAKPYLKQITLKFVTDLSAALDVLRQGAVDGWGGIDAANAASLSSQKFNLYDLALPQYTAIFFNPQQNEHLKNQSIRQALNYATNRLELIQQLSSRSHSPATGPLVVGELKNKTANITWPFNLEQAQKLIAQAGFSKNQAGEYFTNSAGEPLAIVLTTVEQNQYLAIAAQIKEQWTRAGIKVELDIVPAGQSLNNVINSRAYQALLANEITGLDPDPYPFWHSSQIAAPGLNLALFQNHEADKLLTEARQTSNTQQRQEKYIKFQNILKEESPAVFLLSKSYLYAVSYRLRGLDRQLISQAADRFFDIASWYTKITRE